MGKFNIQRFKAAMTIAHGASVTTADFTVNPEYPLNGLLRQVNLQTPASVDGSATAKISLIDADGFTVYQTGTGVAANSKNIDLLTTPIPLANIATIRVTFSANQTTTDSTTNVALLVER